MQTKKMLPLLLSLFITAAATAQSKGYDVTTINNNKPVKQEASFHVTVAANKKATTFSLWIENPEKKKLWLQISHRYSGTVIDTMIDKEEFSQRYNMEGADDGNYTVTVSCGKEKVIKELELNTITTRNVVLH